MSSPTSKYIKVFIIRFILGTIFVLCLISAMRVMLTNRKINKATNLINNSKPIPAVDQLQTASLWTTSYPSQARRIDYLMANASLMQNDHTSAKKYINAISTHKQRTLADAPSLWEKSLVYPDHLINLLLKEYAPKDWDVDPEIAQSLLKTYTTNNRLAYQPNSKQPLSAMPDMPGMPDIPSLTPSPTLPLTTERIPPPGASEWGLTANHETAIYSINGKLRGHIPAGNMFVVNGRKSSSKGDLLICTITMKGKKYPKTILRSKDAIVYNCNLADTTDAQRSLSTQHAKLLGQISKRESQLKKSTTNKNPYAAQYKQALAEYKTMAKKSNTILKQYNNSTGARRMEFADKLRLIKHDALTSKENYTAAKKQYKGWKTNNSSGNLDFSNDQQIISLQQKVAAIERQLSNP